MIGLALVTLVAVMAAGITKSFRGAVNDLWVSGYAITAQNNFDPIPIAAGNAAAQTPGVQAIANVRGGDAQIFDEVHQATAVGPGGAQIFNMNWLDGGSNAVFTRLGAHGAFVDNELREEAPPDDRLAADADRADRQERRPARARHLRPADRRLARSARVTISDTAWDKIYDAPAEPLLVRPDARRRDRREQGCARAAAGVASRTRRCRRRRSSSTTRSAG